MTAIFPPQGPVVAEVLRPDGSKAFELMECPKCGAERQWFVREEFVRHLNAHGVYTDGRKASAKSRAPSPKPRARRAKKPAGKSLFSHIVRGLGKFLRS